LRCCGALQHLVVQDGAAFVERDDGVVRQLLLAQAAGLQELELDLELAGARAERPGRGKVAHRAQAAGFTHADQLVRRLDGTLVIDPIHQIRRIDGPDAPGHELLHEVAYVRGTAQVLRKRGPGGVTVRYRGEVEMRGPVVLRGRGRLVPVVGRLMQEELRAFARLEPDEAVGHVRERCPDLEGRVDAEGVGLVVLEDHRRRTGVDQHPVVAAGLERTGKAVRDHREVGSICPVEVGPEVGWHPYLRSGGPRFYALALCRNLPTTVAWLFPIFRRAYKMRRRDARCEARHRREPFQALSHPSASRGIDR
jgi:hypothetical protein